MVSDLNKNFGGSMDLAQKRHGLADLHTPIHPPQIASDPLSWNRANESFQLTLG